MPTNDLDEDLLDESEEMPEDLNEEDLDELDDEDVEDLDDEDLDEDDVEVDLVAEEVDQGEDVQLKAPRDDDDEEEDEDEDDEEDDEEVGDVDERGESPLRVLPKQPGEFVCQSCFLVKHPSQLADDVHMLCRDCV